MGNDNYFLRNSCHHVFQLCTTSLRQNSVIKVKDLEARDREFKILVFRLCNLFVQRQY